jgi:hypothetical protein
MRKLFILAVAFVIAFAGIASALNETNENGPQHITACYIVGAGPVTSGDVVVLKTSSPSYYGGEVTGSNTAGLPIHGVVVDSRSYTSEEIADGKWVKVQVYGYCSIVKIKSGTTVTAGSAFLVTSHDRFKATNVSALNSRETSFVTGNDIALEAKTAGINDTHTIKAWLSW